MPRPLSILPAVAVTLSAILAPLGAPVPSWAQTAAPPQFLPPVPPAPLFFREPWRQTGAFDASTNFRPAGGITRAAVTSVDLELRLYDPGAKNIPRFAKTPPPGSYPTDWHGEACVQLSGFNQNPPPKQVPAGQPSDPPNLWTGVCETPVAVTLRHRANNVDLTGNAKIRWVTRASGFHVVRPVVKVAGGPWLVGEYADGAASTNSQLFLESEFAVSSIRWLELDMDRVVTRGTWVQNPDLRRVEEVGFADLHPGSGHGWGGFVNVGRIEVYGRAVPRK